MTRQGKPRHYLFIMVNQEANQPLKARTRIFYGYIVVIAVFILQVVMFGPLTSFGVYFKPMLLDFGWSRALISGAYSAFSIVRGLAGIGMGGLNDRLGPRLVITFCGILLGIGYLLMSQIDAAWQLYLLYVLIIGSGMGGLIAPQLSTVARWFVKRRSVMTGIVIAGGGTGGMIVPPVANLLISTYGWRNAYIIMGAVILVIIIITAQFLRRDPAQMGQVPYGEEKRQEQALDSSTEGLSLREATGTRQFWMVFAILFCFGFGALTVLLHIVPHITDLGISATTAANILAVIGGATLVGSIMLGVIANRFGNRQALIICFILMSLAFFWLLIAREVWMLYLFAIVTGFVNGGITTLQSPLAAELFGIRSHGLILGISNFFNTIGSAIGPFIAGYIFDVTSSYNLAFLICAAVSIIGFILTVMLRPIKR
jgi:MFS family permease